MKYPALAVYLLASVALVSAAEPSAMKVQTGRLSTVHLLATARVVPGKGLPDGMRFLFLVKPIADQPEKFTLNETRDFQLAGESYQAKTQAELGKKFEPGTLVDPAEGFFAKQPGMRRLAPENIKGAYILSIAIGGTKLEPQVNADVTIHVGYGLETEAFTFRTNVPPAPVAKSPAKTAN